MAICRSYDNLPGQAILEMRSGNARAAINVYLKILSKLPVYKLIDQLKILNKHHRPSYLGYSEQEDCDERAYLSRGDERRNMFVPE